MKLMYKLHGSDDGPVTMKWQAYGSSYLAVAAYGRNVNLYDRNGTLFEMVHLKQPCIGFDWSYDGSQLAILEDKSSELVLWDKMTRRTQSVSAGIKDFFTVLKFSKVNDTLAAGTSKGNLVIVSGGTNVPIIGKHSKRVTMIDWNTKENLLATYGDDHRIIVSSAEGVTVSTLDMRGEISGLQFDQLFPYTADEYPEGWKYITAISGKGKALTVAGYTGSNPPPSELTFQREYGQIVCYSRVGDRTVLIGFSKGLVIGIELTGSDLQTASFSEVFRSQDYVNTVAGIAPAPVFGRVACAGEGSVKLHSLTEFSQVIDVVNVDDGATGLDNMCWSSDEHLLAISLKNGDVNVYLAMLPVIGASHDGSVAFLTNLKEVSYVSPEHEHPTTANVLSDVTHIALHLDRLAVVSGTVLTVFSTAATGLVSIFDTEYPSPVSHVMLGADHVATLMDNGKLRLHSIDNAEEPGADRAISFPQKDRRDRRKDRSSDRVTCVDYQSEFVVFGMKNGTIQSFLVEEWDFVYSFGHSCGIKKLSVAPSGLVVCFVDDKDGVHVLDMVKDVCILVDLYKGGPRADIRGIFWEHVVENSEVFVVWDSDSTLITCAAQFTTVRTPEVLVIGETQLPNGHVPMRLEDGMLGCITSFNKRARLTLSTHSLIHSNMNHFNFDQMHAAFDQTLVLGRLEAAYAVACQMDSPEVYEQLALVALNFIQLQEAQNCYRKLRNAAMVEAIDDLKTVDDAELLRGLIFVLLNESNEAQQALLHSSNALESLQLCRDLFEWEKAMQLAKGLASDQLPFISRDYAQDLETGGDYGNAMYHYERGVTKQPENASHDIACRAGIARVALRLGELKRGVSLAMELDQVPLSKECASILEGLKQYAEAAQLYEKAHSWEKAVTLYLRNKSWQKATELLEHCTSNKVHLQYAKAMEAIGQYEKAANAYIRCREYPSAVRLFLEQLNDVQKAIHHVDESGNAEAATVVSNHFLKIQDYNAAVHFLICAQRQSEAFAVAKKHDEMEEYARVTGTDGEPHEYRNMAEYFEGHEKHLQAALAWLRAEDYPKSLRQYIAAATSDPELEEESIEGAIETVCQSGSAAVSAQLSAFLMGETDGEPKSAKYLFSFYMRIKKYREAAHSATLMAREEMLTGQYMTARDMLVKMYRDLRNEGIKPSTDLAEDLRLVHSYIMVKYHLSLKDQLAAGRLLLRTANSISKFPGHAVQILSSTVITLYRAGMRNSSFKTACTLMKTEYRSSLDPKYKERFEKMVRRPDKSEIDELLTPCPYCDGMVGCMRTDCPECKNILPYCIITGQHMVKDDWSACPNCKFPALYSEFVKYLATAGEEENLPCLMCKEPIEKESVTVNDNPDQVLRDLSTNG